MKIVHRFGFYMGGFSIGLVFLMFFLSGKKTSCAYGPDARVLKNIQTKRPQYSESVREQLNSKIIDTLTLHSIFKNADINFKFHSCCYILFSLFYIRLWVDKQNITI